MARKTSPAAPPPRRRTGGRWLLASIPLGLVAIFIAVVALRPDPAAPECVMLGPDTIGKRSFPAPPCMQIDDRQLYFVRFETSKGPLTLMLDPRLARKTVNNFVFLAEAGFFDDTTFHRVEKTAEYAYIQGGDPTGTGRGTPGYTYGGEEPSPITEYKRGFVAMANTGNPADNGSQFFIVADDWEAISNPQVTPIYTFFGIVRGEESFATLDAIVAAPRDGVKPDPPVTIERVDVRSIPAGDSGLPDF